MNTIFYSAYSYAKTISVFVCLLFNSGKFRFIFLNIGGIFAKVLLLIAFIVAIKCAALVYTGQLHSLWENLVLSLEIDGSSILLVTNETMLWLISVAVFSLFLASGASNFLYTILLSKYAYSVASRSRIHHAKSFLSYHKNSPEDNRRKQLRDYLFTNDPKLNRSMKLSIIYVFELLQCGLVIIFCMIAIGIIMPIVMYILLIILVVLVPLFLWKSYIRTKRLEYREKELRDANRISKSSLLDHKGARDIEDSFASDFYTILDSELEKELDFIGKRGERDTRFVQLLLHVMLGIFFTAAIVIAARPDDIQHTMKLSQLILLFFIVRFMFGMLQNFLTAIRHINTEYPNLKRVIIEEGLESKHA